LSDARFSHFIIRRPSSELLEDGFDLDSLVMTNTTIVSGEAIGTTHVQQLRNQGSGKRVPVSHGVVFDRNHLPLCPSLM